jgi:hypothetical protein
METLLWYILPWENCLHVCTRRSPNRDTATCLLSRKSLNGLNTSLRLKHVQGNTWERVEMELLLSSALLNTGSRRILWRNGVVLRTFRSEAQPLLCSVHTPLRVTAFNANGIWSRRYELSKQLQGLHVDVSLLSETHLKPHERFFIPTYFYPADRFPGTM